MSLFRQTLIAVLFLTCLSGARAEASSGAPLEQESIRTLLNQVMKVMEAVHAPLGFSEAQFEELLAPAETLTDPATQLPFRTQRGHPLIYYVIEPEGACAVDLKRTVLFIGGIHPDEVSPMYSSFHALYELLTNPYSRPDNTRVIYVPLTNPEGLVDSVKRVKVATRENSRGKDLNRGFEETPARTEAEVAFVKALIAKFNPSHIVALHAPYGWVDYDGPAKQPKATDAEKQEVQQWEEHVSAAGLKPLPVARDFGSYHGSLGNYGGYKLHKHVLTIEYPDTDGRKAEGDWQLYGDTVIEAINPPMHEEPTPPLAYDAGGASVHLRSAARKR